MSKTRPRVIILGIDGGTFSVLQPWMRDGKLPHLARLAEIGISGQLMSMLPPYTGTAWVSFATGKGPGKHGIVDFWQQNSRGGLSLIDARAVRAEYIWHYLS